MARKGEVTVLHVHEGNRQDFHLQQISLSTHAKYFFYKFFVISSSLKKCIVLESISVHQFKKKQRKTTAEFCGRSLKYSEKSVKHCNQLHKL